MTMELLSSGFALRAGVIRVFAPSSPHYASETVSLGLKL